MDEVFWVCIALLIVAFICAVYAWAFMAALVIAACLTVLTLPAIVSGFVRGWKGARSPDNE